ncbi:unnamed protein product [Phytophthora fragariaefolia]|uniref:E3 ubiquitin protein ligase n=1 Tax=Phytophthora fragariaefolia TaxID=1490495 RepID=A0A9W6U6E2_9STRA|nr:unnamed protein product [Phytophthora fragariaefolia]
MTEKWEKRITKIQSEMSKTKSQMDELNLKNVSLRERLSNSSSYRDQVSYVFKENNQFLVLTFPFGYSAGIYALKSLSEVEAKLEKERQELHESSSEREKLRTKIEEMKASSEASREENDALLLEIDTISKEVDSLRHNRKKYLQQIDEKRNANKKLHTLLAKMEQSKAHCFEELAAVRLQVSSLSTVHKHQKAFIESSKDIELEKMKEFIKTIEAEREASDAEKRKVIRDAEVAKKICATAEKSQREQQLLQEKPKACEKCESYRKKIEEVEQQLQHAKSASSTGELTDLERFELRDLQKLVNCSVCQDRRKDVIISKCFHMFCKECVENNLKSRNRKCPTCKKMFGHDDVKSVWFT